jgi:hypothetical protein
VGYKIHTMSERAKRIFIPIIKNKKPFPQTQRIARDFPFFTLLPGQSFFVVFKETLPYDRVLVKERMQRYNRFYDRYFVALLHRDEPKRIEIARIV